MDFDPTGATFAFRPIPSPPHPGRLWLNQLICSILIYFCGASAARDAPPEEFGLKAPGNPD